MAGTRVLIVGPFPTLFAVGRGFLGIQTRLVKPLLDEQVSEYPRPLLDELAKVGELARKLVSLGFRVRLVHVWSPYGLMLALRHRIGVGFYAVVNRRCVKIEGEVGEVVKEISRSASDGSGRRFRFRTE
ncbi:MAG: hypothetical protein QXX49_01095 [Candidatus Caldarchaeum sp.]